MSQNYLDCISAQELDRLKAQHQAWSPETHSFLRSAGFAKFERVGEFGCGPGFTAFDLAGEICPQAEVTAVDVSDYYLNYVRARIAEERIGNMKVVKQDATVRNDSAGDFDGAFCRWFLAWVTKDIDTVLRNIHDSLRPGGTFAAMEYLTLKSVVYSPPCAALQPYIRAWENFYSETGGTTDVGSSLPAKLVEAGFKITETKCVGGYAPQGQRLFAWWRRLYEEFRGKFLERGLLKQHEADELDEFWQLHGLNPSSFIYSPVLIQISAVKQ